MMTKIQKTEKQREFNIKKGFVKYKDFLRLSIDFKF